HERARCGGSERPRRSAHRARLQCRPPHRRGGPRRARRRSAGATALGTVMAYLLDTPVVSCVLQARRENELARAATIVGCAIAEDVRAEIAADPARGPLFQRWLPASHVEVVSIVVGSAT